MAISNFNGLKPLEDKLNQHDTNVVNYFKKLNLKPITKMGYKPVSTANVWESAIKITGKGKIYSCLFNVNNNYTVDRWAQLIIDGVEQYRIRMYDVRSYGGVLNQGSISNKNNADTNIDDVSIRVPLGSSSGSSYFKTTVLDRNNVIDLPYVSDTEQYKVLLLDNNQYISFDKSIEILIKSSGTNVGYGVNYTLHCGVE